MRYHIFYITFYLANTNLKTNASPHQRRSVDGSVYMRKRQAW